MILLLFLFQRKIYADFIKVSTANIIFAISCQVRQGIGNRYPSLSTIFSFAERGTKESTISSPSPSTSKSNEPKVREECYFTHEYHFEIKYEISKVSIISF